MNQDHIENILNRKPSKWRNLTIQEFERDIALLQTLAKEGAPAESPSWLWEVASSAQPTRDIDTQDKPYSILLATFTPNGRECHIIGETDDVMAYFKSTSFHSYRWFVVEVKENVARAVQQFASEVKLFYPYVFHVTHLNPGREPMEHQGVGLIQDEHHPYNAFVALSLIEMAKVQEWRQGMWEKGIPFEEAEDVLGKLEGVLNRRLPDDKKMTLLMVYQNTHDYVNAAEAKLYMKTSDDAMLLITNPFVNLEEDEVNTFFEEVYYQDEIIHPVTLSYSSPFGRKRTFIQTKTT